MQQLIILCASHLKTDENIVQMREMLDSQMAQTLLCDVYVSYTIESTHSFNYDNPRVHLIKQPESQLTQFQHYTRLIAQLWSDGSLHSKNYVIFTDDDDIMAPERNATYFEYIQDGIEVIRLENSVIRFSLDCNIQERSYSIQDALKNSNVIITYLNPSEYVELCLRGDILMDFMNLIDDEKAMNYVCDCGFNFKVKDYICANPETTRTIISTKPLYYYRYSMFRSVRHKYLEELNNSVD